MEIERNHFMLRQKLGFFLTLREALLLCKNINFVASVSLASLPLFCFLVFYEEVLQRALLEIFEILTDPLSSSKNYLITLLRISGIVRDYSREFVYLGLLSLVPLQILKLFTTIVATDLASKVYREKSAISLNALGGLVRSCVEETRFKGILRTSVYVLFLSTGTLVVSIWLVTIYYVTMKGLLSDIFFAALLRAACFALLGKYLKWSAVWNMSIVISVLEEVYGTEAFLVSVYYNRGFEKQGFLMMLIFSAWEHSLRVLCMFAKTYVGRGAVFGEVCMLCLGNVMKWVVFVVGFHNCKRSILEKKVDEEAARDINLTWQVSKLHDMKP